MATDKWEIWKKKGLAKEDLREANAEDDVEAVSDYLKEVNLKKLVKELEALREMIKEEKVIEEGLKIDNLKKQLIQMDMVLQSYDFFQDDVDINGLRLKKIAQELLKKAKEQGMKDLVKEKQKDMKWRDN